MYKTLDKHKMFKPLLIIAIMFATIAGGLLWQGETLVRLPGTHTSVVYADKSDDKSDDKSESSDDDSDSDGSGTEENAAIFDDLMADGDLSDWGEFTKKNKSLPSGTGAYWTKVNRMNSFLGVTTGTSRAISYNDPTTKSDGAKAASKAANLMRAYTDTGLDHSFAGGAVANAMTILARFAGGIFILLPMIIIAGVNAGFNMLLTLADYLNVFKYLANHTVPDGVMGTAVSAINKVYTAFTDMGLVVAGLVLAFTLFAYAIGMHQLNDGRRLGSLALRYLLRIFVVVAGPFVIAVTFSSIVTNLKDAYDSPKLADSTIMSNMVDFEKWTYHSRLGLPDSLNKTLSSTSGKSKDLTAKQVRAINSAGAGHVLGKDSSSASFKMVTRWMTGAQVDAGQYASYFQINSSDNYYTDDAKKTHKELKSLKDSSWVRGLVTSGGISVENGGKGTYFTNGSNAPIAGGHHGSFKDADGYGLSTVGMYNYLSSYDTGGGMQWSRIGSLANDVSKPGHYSVGFAGRGVKFFVNYLSVVISLSAAALLALVFAWRAVASIFKGFFGTLVRAFTSGMSGSPVELSKLLAEFLSMIVQLFGGAFLYQISTELLTAFSNDSSGLFTNDAGAVMMAAGFGTIATQLVKSLIILVIAWNLTKYAGKFNKAIDDFLSQGIDRIMGRAGYAGQASTRNEGGLTDGAGNAGTGGGMNNDGISSNGNMLTNPDGWIGRRANRKAKNNEVMNNAADQTPAGRKKALRKYRAEKGLGQAVRGAGFEGAGNDLENIADLHQRQAKNRQGEDDEEDKDVKQNEDVKNPSFGDGSQDEDVKNQDLTNDEKSDADEPPLEYDDQGNPTAESLARQQAYANHAVGDTKPDSEDTPDKGIAGEDAKDRQLRRGVMDASQANKALETAKRDVKNATNPEEKAEAEQRVKEASDALVQNAESDVRTAQNDLANAKTPEEQRIASNNLNDALTAYRVAQNEAQQAVADSDSTLEAGKTRGEVANDAQRSMDILENVDNLRSKALDTQAIGSENMQGARDAMQKDFADKNSPNHDSLIARKSGDAQKLASNVESAYKNSPNAKEYTKPDANVRQAKIDKQVARNTAVQKAIKANPAKAKAYKSAQGAVKAARQQYAKTNGSAASLAAYQKASNKLDKIESSAIQSLGPNDSAYKALQTAEKVADKTISTSSLAGRIDSRPEIVQAADTQAQAIMQGAIGKTTPKLAHQVQANRKQMSQGKVEYRQANQFLEDSKSGAKTKVGATVLQGNRELGSKVITKYGHDMAKAKGGTQTAQPMFENIKTMSPEQAVATVQEMPVNQQRTMQRAILRGEESAPELVQKALAHEITNSAVKQQYGNFRTKGQKKISLATMNSAAKEFAKLETKRSAIAKDANLNPAEQNRQAQAVAKAQQRVASKLGNATAAQKLMTAKYRNKVRTDYANVVDNAKMGIDYNVSGKMKQPKLVKAVSEGISKDSHGRVTHVARQHASADVITSATR